MVAAPLALFAVGVAARPAEDRLERELGRVDGDRPGDRVGRAWRTDRAALALAAAATAFVVSGLTVAFDLAQVRTFGFELRTLDVQGVPAGAVRRGRRSDSKATAQSLSASSASVK